MAKIKFEWEILKLNLPCVTSRAKVIGGWIVSDYVADGPAGMVFIPDPNHDWEIDNG